MSSIDLLLMAVRNLFKRKLRTFLTILGVIVGTGAIVIMISLGIAMNQSFEKQLDNMGDITKITIYNPNYYSSGSSKNQKDTTITKSTIEDIKKINGVKSATPIIDSYLKFKIGKYVANMRVSGIDPSTMIDFNYKLQNGRLLDESDNGEFNLVFGGDAPFNFYKPSQRMNFWNDQTEKTEPDVDVMNDKVTMSYDYNYGEKNASTSIKAYKVKAVGILSRSDENSYTIFAPIDKVEKLAAEQRKWEQKTYGPSRNSTSSGYQSAYVKCVHIDSVKEVSEQLKGMGFEVYSAMDSVSSMQELSGSLQMLLGAIGAVSLFIAAIGITNTMIMSIYERTREIGIMKVVGARLSDIKRLFLLEAIMIGFWGGLFGILISIGVSAILNNVGISFLQNMQSVDGGNISTIPIWLCVLALAFSSLVGLISGYFPARKAMNLSALSALRKE